MTRPAPGTLADGPGGGHSGSRSPVRGAPRGPAARCPGQVAHPAVDQLGAAAGGAVAKSCASSKGAIAASRASTAVPSPGLAAADDEVSTSRPHGPGRGTRPSAGCSSLGSPGGCCRAHGAFTASIASRSERMSSPVFGPQADHQESLVAPPPRILQARRHDPASLAPGAGLVLQPQESFGNTEGPSH